ncbi:hypothetical protein [Candidatus Chromulinivorax destructor]|uniref:Uncharacterized protein n=1 Tax=Candidatus Chromulinivorax destructor TaxID=2066483 RepID=A0A345ZB79_9BACT|nr:hypothetical protein [Candidatus Chromulinivorax destructor]AXK60546.1 hypothetical protein C0J27_02185 [Candidatus Chromulinivorax destructor]
MKKLSILIAFSFMAIAAENIYAGKGKTIHIHNTGTQRVELWQQKKDGYPKKPTYGDTTCCNGKPAYGLNNFEWGKETLVGTINPKETTQFTLVDDVDYDGFCSCTKIRYLIKNFNKQPVDTQYRPASDEYFDGHKKDTMQF